MIKKPSQKIRLILGFILLCAMTVGILFTGPEFNFAWQVVLVSFALFFLFWLIT